MLTEKSYPERITVYLNEDGTFRDAKVVYRRRISDGDRVIEDSSSEDRPLGDELKAVIDDDLSALVDVIGAKKALAVEEAKKLAVTGPGAAAAALGARG